MRVVIALVLLLGACGPCQALVCTDGAPCWRSDFTCDDETNVAMTIPIHRRTLADDTLTLRFYLSSGDAIRVNVALPFGPLFSVSVHDDGTLTLFGDVECREPCFDEYQLRGELTRGRTITVKSYRHFAGANAWDSYLEPESWSDTPTSATFPPSR